MFMPYGDGASFSGYRSEPWPVPSHPGRSLTFRGMTNFDQTFAYLFANLGLQNATQFVLTGGSAGGLSTFLHLDRAAAFLRERAPLVTSIKGAPVVGYFLDHANFAHSSNNYTAWMQYIVSMQNVTAQGGALNQACVDDHKEEPWMCFMAPHMQAYIQTPWYMFNSKFDSWQLANILQTPWTTKAEQAAVIAYGADFMQQFEPVAAEQRNGAFITSCICHGCPWSTLVLDGLTSLQLYARWHAGTIVHPQSIAVDQRGPNGDGAITDKLCLPFPKQLQ